MTPPRLLGRLVHVEQDLCLAALLDRAQQAADIEAAVAHRRALADRQHAVRRGDQRRAVGRDEAVEDHAAGFEELGRQRHVDLADRRIERQHRRRAALRRHHFEIVGRGAGALGHARDLRRLHAQPLALRGGDDPVAQHAAAIAAQRADQDGDGLHDRAPARPGEDLAPGGRALRDAHAIAPITPSGTATSAGPTRWRSARCRPCRRTGTARRHRRPRRTARSRRSHC